MNYELFDSLRDYLRVLVESKTPRLFPLEDALAHAQAEHVRCAEVVCQLGVAEADRARAGDFLLLLNSTAVGAAIAVKRVSAQGGDTSGITTALVDLWGQAEAARALWFDQFVRFPADGADGREFALRETSRQLGPQAVAIATQLKEPVLQYIDFVSKVA